MILLISPNSPGSYRSSNINDENLALGYLAAVLETNGHQVEFIDARMKQLSPESVAMQIQKLRPFFLGISVISKESITWIEKMSLILNSPNYIKHICMGGYYPSLQPESVLRGLPFVDSVAMGEGEHTIVELIKKIQCGESWNAIEGIVSKSDKGSIVANLKRKVITNLDTLPFPKRYADQNNTEIVIEGSRGCFGKCVFCAFGTHFNANRKFAWRGRSPKHIVMEMLLLRKLLPNNFRYRFIDPNFFGSYSQIHSDRILKLSSLIKNRIPGIELYIEARVIDIRRRDVLVALKQAGLKEVYLGIESGSEKILALMGKSASVSDAINATQLLEELEINYQYGHMMITPWTEYEDIIDSLALLRKIGRVQFDKLFNELYVIPGTGLVDQLKKQNSLIKEESTGYYSYETNQLVRNIRAFSIAYETVYKDFSEYLWFLYKDVQRHEQCNIPGATTIQLRLSGLFIAIFEYCLERSREMLLSDFEVLGIAEEAIARFQSKLKSIQEALNPSIVFPRPVSKMSGK